MLLIDEVDRADDEFEAFLLEFLSDFAITIPELGTVTARRRPLVVLTSNRTRELHDALKRRCLYHWIDYPSPSARRRSCARGCPACPTRRRARLRRGRPAAPRGALQAARRGGDDHVGAGAARARRRRATSRHARRRAEGARGHRPRARARGAAWRLRPPRARSGARERARGARCAPAARASAWASCSPPTARWPPSTRPSRTDAYFALRAALCSTRAELALFARRVRGRVRAPASRRTRSRRSARSRTPRCRASASRSGRRRARSRRAAATRCPPPTATRSCCARRTSPSYTDAERALARRLLARIAARAPQRLSRRTRPTRRRREVHDLRATVRASLRHGGELMERRYREPGAAPAPARARLRRLGLDGAVRADAAPVPAGVASPPARASRRSCSARGSRASRASSRAAIPTARWQRAAERVTDWSGGTRIGAALAELNREHGRRIGRGAVVVILSDGWDRGDPDAARRRDGAPAPHRAPAGVAEPARRRPALRAAHPRHARRAAARGPPAARQLDRLAGIARRPDGGRTA